MFCLFILYLYLLVMGELYMSQRSGKRREDCGRGTTLERELRPQLSMALVHLVRRVGHENVYWFWEGCTC
jgi:hypothetical protein